MTMPITNAQYSDMKEYWDYQRKVQYNKELVFQMAEQFENKVYNEYGLMDIQEIKEQIWTRVKSEDYEEPHKEWVPQDSNYRFEWETDLNTKRLPVPKGKPVIVASKDKWQDIIEELNVSIKDGNDNNI